MAGEGEAAVTGPVDEAQSPPSSPPARATRIALGTMVAVTVAVIALDLIAKQLAVVYLPGRDPVRLLGGLIYLDLTRNGGAAFSLGTRYTFVFPVVAVAVVIWLGFLASRLRSVPWAVAFGLVIGGALGNVGDRLFRAPGFLVGHVVDFVSLFGPNGQYWPILNVADASLSCGVVLAVLLEFTGRRRDGTRAGRRGQS